MSSPRAGLRALSVALVAVLATLSPAAALAPPVPAATFVLGAGLSVTAPAPGYGVAASALMVDGGHLELVLETGLDGVTRVVADEPSAARAATAPRIAGGGGVCDDAEYNLARYKWKTTWKWWFLARSTPGELTRSKAESHLRSSVASITGSRNDCGMADQVNATASYQGRTTTRPGVTSGGGCRQDGKSVVGFGDLPAGLLGLACTAYLVVSGVKPAVESDVLFNKDDFSWRTSVSGCSNQAILRSVATHEFGHVFGLDHVGEGNHGRLTMSIAIGACDDSAYTLGKGDVLGLRKRY